MKRRQFLTSGILSIIAGKKLLASYYDMNFQEGELVGSPPENLECLITSYFDKIFYSKKIDLNNKLKKGIIVLADSYEVTLNTEKTTIFDIAEDVVEKLRSKGFNAEALLEGKIPNGLQVGSSAISFYAGGYFNTMKIPGLKNYDAELLYKNPVTIKFKVPLFEVVKETKFDLALSSDKVICYKGEKTKTMVFTKLEDITTFIDVDKIEPLKISTKEPLGLMAFKKETFSEYLSEEFKKLILS
jgi:hypothetical protein